LSNKIQRKITAAIWFKGAINVKNPPYQNPFTAVWFIKIHHRRLVSTSLPPSTHHCRRHQNRTTKGEEQQNQNLMTNLKDKE
jgi:hypothetical protein